ncbi:hypothetical protein BGZ93_006790 [Podila epicladia]|nr:hypothetical protein BGZ92_000105 [Podila epicladia]KAG0094762.1 hypothetical protein BGZ93_006790 [Podila epicladia]
MNRVLLVPIFSLVIISFALSSLWYFEFQFERRGQQPPAGVPGSLSRQKIGQFWGQETASGTKYLGFVHKPCTETIAFGYTWFTTIYNIVCDKNDPSPLCTVWLENSNGYESLGEKSLALWKFVHDTEDTPDIVVKLDDDTVIQKQILDEFIDDFAKSPAVIGGTMNKWTADGYDFWWPLGRLYMYKKSAMPESTSHIWENASHFNKYEDGQIGYIMDVPTNDNNRIFRVNETRFHHSHYIEGDPGWDKRVEIKFRHLTAPCPAPQH